MLMNKPINVGMAAACALLLAANQSVRANYNPVVITPGSYNQDIVVEKTALVPLLQGGIPSNYQTNFVTATMDGGTAVTGYTWNEIGYPGNSTPGLPHPGTTFTAASPASPVHQFTMPPTYRGNCCIFVDPSNGGSLNFTTPAAYTSLSILNTAGNGPVAINYTISYQDGTTQTGSFNALDWFNSAAAAYAANGRVYAPYLQAYTSSGNCKLFATDIALSDTSSAVTNVAFSYGGSGGRSCIFAIAGQSVASGAYSPVAVTGYNFDSVVELQNDKAYTTATMDNGTGNTGNTWYEAGYDPAATTTGLPAAGSTITSANLTDHQYTLAASYTANNAILIDTNHQTANITLVYPTNYTSFSFLTAGGNIVGGHTMTNYCIMQHQDGTSETNLFLAYDWFESGQPAAYNGNGRVNVNDTTLNNVNNAYPKLFESQFALGNTVSPVTNIVIRYNIAPFANSTTYILAVSATAGSVSPIIASSPVSTNVYPGTTVVLTAGVSGGTSPVTNQWQFRTNGVWINLANGGNVSGVTTTALTITNSAVINSADYRFVASNVAGTVASLPATVIVVSPLADVATAGDPIADFGDAGTSPAGADVTYAIDHTSSKFLTFGLNNGAPFAGPVGLVITPSLGATVVSGLRIYTANDHSERDPANYQLEGSTDGGVTYTLISSNALSLPDARNGAAAGLTPTNQYLAQVIFANSASYSTYRLTFYDVKNDATANSLQFGEVEFLGVQAPVPPTIYRQPASAIALYSGASATLSVAAAGPQPISYQWIKNGTTVVGTGTNLLLTGISLGDSGNTYTCAITNIYGATNSITTTLTVVAAPTNAYPQAVLAANPVGYWRLDESPDDGAGNNGVVAHDYWGGYNGIYTNSEIALTGYPSTPPDTDTAARFGNIATADSFAGQIPIPGFATNGNAAFSIEAWVAGPAQSADGGIITKGTGAGGEQFNLDTGAGSNHSFRFFVRDAAGGVHLANGTVAPDGNWHHLVGVCDELNSNVLLYVDGVLNGSASIAPGAGIQASANPMSIGSRQGAATGSYNQQFLGEIDEVAVFNVALTAAQIRTQYYAAGIAPLITLQPTNATANEGGNVSFVAAATGTPALAYQWSENDVPLTGATNATLTLTNVPFSHNGYYYSLNVTNEYGTASSSTAYLTVSQGPPTLTADITPLQFTGFVGMSLSYSVSVSGSAPFSYQWLRNAGTILPSTNATYSFSVLPGTNTYSCTITNGGGSVTSSTATVIGINATNPATSFAINFHDFANNAAYDGANYTEYVLYVGQGPYADTNNNVWNGFGDAYTTGLSAVTSAGINTPVTFSVSYDGDNGAIWNYDDNANNNALQGTPGFILGQAALVSGGNIGTFTFNNVPAGNYDLYATAANYDGDRGARFTVGGYTQAVNNNPAVSGTQPPTNFINGATYVVFHNVLPTNGVITGTWDGNLTNPNTGQSGEGDLTSLQLVKVSVTGVPTLTIAPAAGSVVISWNPAVGQLQAAGNVAGAYTNVPGATSPYTNAPLGQLFYRVKVQ